MKRLIFTSFVLVLLSVPAKFYGQTSTMGRDFIVSVGFIQTGTPTRYLQIAAGDTNTVATITFNEIVGAGRTVTVNIPAGTVYVRSLVAKSAEESSLIATTATGPRSVRIETDHNVSVYVMNSSNNNGDASVVLPVAALGNVYYHTSRAPGSEPDGFVIVSLSNGNNITAETRAGATVFSGTLNAGQSRLVNFPGAVDNTGAVIRGTADFAYFVSNQQLNFGGNNTSMAFEQLMPVSKWGTAFVVPIVNAGDRVRILASSTSFPTSIKIWHTNPPITYPFPLDTSLAAGQVLELTAAAPNSTFYIMAGNPVFVTTIFAVLPAMAQVPPIQQMVNEITIAPFNSNYYASSTAFALVVTATQSRDSAKVFSGTGGVSQQLSMFAIGGWTVCAGNPNLSYCRYPINDLTKSYTFVNNSGLLVWVYSKTSNNSYYYVGGSAARELSNNFYLDSIGELNGQSFCFDQMIRFKASLTLPLSAAPGHLIWILKTCDLDTNTITGEITPINCVDSILTQHTDKFEWFLPKLPNGTYIIEVRAKDIFDTVHVLSGWFRQECPIPRAFDDYVSIASCLSNVTKIDVLANDTLGSCSSGTIDLSIDIPPTKGVASVHCIKMAPPYQIYDSLCYIVYASNTGFVGHDSLKYKIECDDSAKYAMVYINITACPDNIDTTINCLGDPPATALNIKLQDVSNIRVHPWAQPLVADVDGCGKSEVIAFNYTGSFYYSDSILIFDNQLKLKSKFYIGPTTDYLSFPITIADVDGDGKAEIFVLTGYNTVTRTLRCFYYDGTAWINKPGFNQTNTITTINSGDNVCVIVGDINGDGIAELLAHDKIFDAQTGALIATLPAGSLGKSFFSGEYVYYPVLADVDNDGELEVVAGNMVYKVNVTAGTATLAYQAPAGPDIKDGYTSVTDIDLDGYLDVVVTHNDAGTSKCYVWSPYKNKVLGQTMIGTNASGRISRSFIGDINNDGYPEIAFSYYLGMACYRWDASTNTFVQLWREITTDDSGMTTMTMFDFNQDGKQEIVYRDEDYLRIINGETGKNIDSMSCFSNTGTEMPIVVDLAGEGYAQILVSGSPTGKTSHGDVVIRRYVSAIPGAWAPARSVWNQHGYNAVNINSDGTVPTFPLNPATVFPGKDGILGTADDVRPYNGFLMQQTTLNKNGNPIWALPNLKIIDTSHYKDIVNDSIMVKGKVTNIGDAPMIVPIYITVYKNTTNIANIIAFDSIVKILMPGDTINFQYTIKNITSVGIVNSIWFSINDSNGKYPYYTECFDVGGREMFNIDGFTVTYDPNGAPGTRSDRTAPVGVKYGILSLAAALGGIATAGIQPDSTYFDGWNTQPDGTGTRYRPGDSITVTANIELYAIWNSASGIYDWADLAAIATDATTRAGSYILMNNLDKYSGFYETYLGGYGLDHNGGGTSMGGDDSTGWRPIGRNVGASSFSGQFDGNHKTISDIWRRGPGGTLGATEPGAALFYYIDGPNASVRDLSFELGKSGTTGTEAIQKVGMVTMTGPGAALVGHLRNCDTIRNIRVLRGEVRSGTGVGYPAGIIGTYTNGTLADTFINNANIYGTSNYSSAGILGYTYSTSNLNISHGTYFENNGYVDGGQPGTGGIFGIYYSKNNYVFSSLPGADVQVKNTGNIRHQSSNVNSGAGGIIGVVAANTTITVQDYANTVDILGNNTGGIIGNAAATSTVIINRCYNTGAIGTSAVSSFCGGIIGTARGNVKLSNVYNIGLINGLRYIGGLVGCWDSPDSILYSYNAGKVSASRSGYGYGIVDTIGINGLNTAGVYFDTVTSGRLLGAPTTNRYDTLVNARSTCDMIYSLSTSEFSTANGWGYGWDGKHTYPYLLWQTTAGKSNDIGFTFISTEHDHPAPVANPNITIGIDYSGGAYKAFNVHATPVTNYFERFTAGTVCTLATTGVAAGKIISIGAMSESDIVNFEPNVLCANGFPTVAPITAPKKTICVGETLVLSSATPGGIWSINNNKAVINSQSSSPASVTIEGLSEGIVYVSYNFGYCKCRTTQTFQIKVIAPPPEIKIGFEE